MYGGAHLHRIRRPRKSNSSTRLPAGVVEDGAIGQLHATGSHAHTSADLGASETAGVDHLPQDGDAREQSTEVFATREEAGARFLTLAGHGEVEG